MQLSRRKKCLELLLSRRIPAAVAEYLGIPKADEVPPVARVPLVPEVNPLIQAPRLHNQQWTKCQSFKSFSLVLALYGLLDMGGNAPAGAGKLITWGSTDDLRQSYLTSGKLGEAPEPFPLPKEVFIVQAAAGWAHCVYVEGGEVYTWGWKECVPSGKVIGDPNSAQKLWSLFKCLLSEVLGITVSLRSQGSRATGVDGKAIRGESTKRRRVSSTKQVVESSLSADEPLSAFPCLVALNSGVRIATVTAGRFHTGPGFFINAIADLLSTIIVMFSSSECVSLLSSLFSHNACVTAAVAAMNSDSHDDSDTVACFYVLHLIGDLP
nr:hypothetical protein [Tanacetum cinerariifolium]